MQTVSYIEKRNAITYARNGRELICNIFFTETWGDETDEIFVTPVGHTFFFSGGDDRCGRLGCVCKHGVPKIWGTPFHSTNSQIRSLGFSCGYKRVYSLPVFKVLFPYSLGRQRQSDTNITSCFDMFCIFYIPQPFLPKLQPSRVVCFQAPPSALRAFTEGMCDYAKWSNIFPLHNREQICG